MVRELQYERIAQLIALAAISRTNEEVLQQFSVRGSVETFSNGMPVQEPRQLVVRFSSYVKSQIHLCIVKDLFGRSIIDYINAARYLQGYRIYRENAEKVLRYFYEDMSRFLINNPYNIMFWIIADVDFEVESVSVAEVRREFEQLLESSGSSELYAKISGFKYAHMVDNLSCVDSLQDARAKIDSYVVAAILHELAGRQPVHALEMEEWDAVKDE